MHTCASVTSDATINWYCYPDFDSPSIFGSILDRENGPSRLPKVKHFLVLRDPISLSCRQQRESETEQFYHPDTNILICRFLSTFGVGQITDFMPVGKAANKILKDTSKGWIVTEISTVRGRMAFEIGWSPRFECGKVIPKISVHGRFVLFQTPDLKMNFGFVRDCA
jgi:GH15 family glucan-1,4-alpha-glucosidase